MNPFVPLVALVLTFLWGWGLWRLSQSKKSSGQAQFYGLFALPFLIPILMVLFARGFFGLQILGLGGLLTFAFILAYLIIWAMTLYIVGGEQETGWFIVIFLFSPIALIIYWIVTRV